MSTSICMVASEELRDDYRVAWNRVYMAESGMLTEEQSAKAWEDFERIVTEIEAEDDRDG